MITYLYMFLYSLVGLAIQSFVKINAINDRTPEDVSFATIFKTYFRKDFPKIGMSVLSIIVVEAIVHGYLNLRASGQTLDVPGASVGLEYKLTFFINAAMAVWGYVSGSFIMSFGSRAERYINKKANDDQNQQPNVPANI